MAKWWKRVGPQVFLEILHTCIAGDTGDFGKDGSERKMQDGMLASGRGMKLLRIWNSPQIIEAARSFLF